MQTRMPSATHDKAAVVNNTSPNAPSSVTFPPQTLLKTDLRMMIGEIMRLNEETRQLRDELIKKQEVANNVIRELVNVGRNFARFGGPPSRSETLNEDPIECPHCSNSRDWRANRHKFVAKLAKIRDSYARQMSSSSN